MSKSPFIFNAGSYMDRVVRGSYQGQLLAEANQFDIMRHVFPERFTFTLTAPEDRHEFECLYLLEGELKYSDSDSETLLTSGDYISRHLIQEIAYFEAKTEVIMLAFSAPGAFGFMREQTKEFYEMAKEIEAAEYVDGHCRRIQRWAGQVGEKLGLPNEQIANILFAAFFHDLGKAKISEEILQKKSPLTHEEWDLMKQHPTWGRQMLEENEVLCVAAPIVEQIHENLDGTGYPFGLKDEQICLEAKIISVAEAYDAMMMDRPYRRPLIHSEAIEALRQGVGTLFDGQTVTAFVDVLNEQEGELEEVQKDWANQEFTLLRQRESFLNIGKEILRGKDIEKILNDVVTGITQFTSFQNATLTLFASAVAPKMLEKANVEQIALSGNDSTMHRFLFDELEPSKRSWLFEKEFKLGQSYFIQHKDIPSQESAVELIAQTSIFKDLLLIPLWISNDEMIGLISVEAHIGHQAPTAEVLEPIEMFANLASIAVIEAKQKQQLHEMAIRDQLTHLYNRRYLNEVIEVEQARAQRQYTPISLMMIDFIGFHELNNRFGHLEGDRILAEVAGLFKGSIRKTDTLVRYGGDEFLLIMPGTSEESAYKVSERFNRILTEKDFGLDFNVAVRTGIASWNPYGTESFDEVLEEADQWMYSNNRQLTVEPLALETKKELVHQNGHVHD